MLEWIQSNQALITLVFSGLVALSTVAYAVLTSRLVRETVRLREAETDPALAVYLSPSERWVGIFDLIIQNHGRGTALNLTWSIDPPASDLSDWKVYFTNMKLLDGLAQLAPGQQVRTFFGQATELLKDPPLPPIRITANYSNGSGDRYEAPFVLDVRQFDGISRLGKPADDEMAKALEIIAKSIKAVTSSKRFRVEVISEEDRVQQDRDRREEAMRRYEQQRNPKPAAAQQGVEPDVE